MLASRGYCSRSEAGMFVRQFDVRSGVTRVTDASKKLADTHLTIDGEPIDPASILVMLNKPVGVTCSHKEEGPLVYHLFPERWQRRNPVLTTVGRLDKETSGLLLLTDDGQLVHRLTSPKRHVPRVYVATLRDPLSGGERVLFASGSMKLEGEDEPLLPAVLEPINEKTVRLTLTEGRYHQVRRMFAAVGNHVESLHRAAFGRLDLGDLPAGEFRAVTMDEIV